MPEDVGYENSKEAAKCKQIWNDYQNGKNYKSGENLYNIIARNERYYAGDQWYGVKSKDLTKLTLNFLEQLADVKISSILANQLTIDRKPDELSEDDEKISTVAKAFTEQDSKNWERLKMDQMNEKMLLDACISGLGGSYWFWDNDIITGNAFKTQGDFKGELIDSANLYVSNPNSVDIQSQDWLMLTYRMTVKQVKRIAKNNNISDELINMIGGDETTQYEGYDKAQNEQDGNKDSSNNITMIMKMWKDSKSKTVHFCKSVNNVIIQEDTDAELERYPVAMMNWKERKKFIFGTAELTYIIANQQHVNKMASMQGLNAMLMSIPKVGYNTNMIKGMTNQIGGIQPVSAPPGTNISSAIHYWQPAQMTIDVDKTIEGTISKTMNFKGINDNVTGASAPENTSAIIAQQRAAGVPLESIKRRFLQYVEDVSLIWLDFYKNKYKLARRLKVEGEQEGEKEVIEFRGTDNKDVYLDTKIDVGASSQWSELLVIETLDKLLEGSFINIVEYLERYPKNIIPDQDKLIEAKKSELEMAEQAELGEKQQPQQPQEPQISEEEMAAMADFIETLSPEIQQQILALPPEQQIQVVQQMQQQGGL